VSRFGPASVSLAITLRYDNTIDKSKNVARLNLSMPLYYFLDVPDNNCYNFNRVPGRSSVDINRPGQCCGSALGNGQEMDCSDQDEEQPRRQNTLTEFIRRFE